MLLLVSSRNRCPVCWRRFTNRSAPGISRSSWTSTPSMSIREFSIAGRDVIRLGRSNVVSTHVRTFTSLPDGDCVRVTAGQGSDERAGQPLHVEQVRVGDVVGGGVAAEGAAAEGQRRGQAVADADTTVGRGAVGQAPLR